MTLQAASKREVKRIAVGSVICAALELAAFGLLDLLGILDFSYRVVLGVVGGVCVAVFSFVILCLSIQKAATMEPGKAMKARMQLGYNIRLLMQAGWVVIAFLVPHFNVLAAAAPLLFPTVIIFFLQMRGKLVEPSERKNPEPSEDDEDDPEDRLETFEA